MQKFFLTSFSLALLLLLPACAHHADKDKDATGVEAMKDGTFDIDEDDKATVTGTVAANQTACTSGTNCYLTLNLTEREVHVIYGYPGGGCKSNDAAKIASGLKPGDSIMAHGMYAHDGNFGIVDVCAIRGGIVSKNNDDKADDKDKKPAKPAAP